MPMHVLLKGFSREVVVVVVVGFLHRKGRSEGREERREGCPESQQPSWRSFTSGRRGRKELGWRGKAVRYKL